MHMIHMDATLAELRLLGKNTRHYQVGYILIASLAFILIASLESLNYKPTKVLAQQRWGRNRQSPPRGTSERAAPAEAKATTKMKEHGKQPPG